MNEPAVSVFISSETARGVPLEDGRVIWKYQSWLQGRGLQAAGLNPTSDPDEAFFVGRHSA